MKMRIELDKKHKLVDFYSMQSFNEEWIEAMTYKEAREFAKKLLGMLDNIPI